MPHVVAGLSGIVVGALFGAAMFCAMYFTKKYDSYNLDPQSRAGAFAPHLARYLRAAEFTIGLATGSIVLLVGSSALHSQGGHLPWFYASPLILLAYCVLYGVAFMVSLIYGYEEVEHGNPHTDLAYALNQTFGFSSLACFCVGYFWLVVTVTT
jgi:hypothetical protein